MEKGVRIKKIGLQDIVNIADRVDSKDFEKFKNLLINDLNKSDWKYLSIEIYTRLGGWCHTGGSYIKGAEPARAISRKILGYTIEESFIINKVEYDIKKLRYKNTAERALIILSYHNQKIKD